MIFDYTLNFDTSLKKASRLVRSLGNCKILNQNNISLNQKLNIWKTYIGSKMLYSLVVLCIMNKTAMKKISTQLSMAIKKCLNLHPGLSREKLYAWLYELSPEEKAELFLLRTLKKLNENKLELKNSDFFIKKLVNCTAEEAIKYLEGETSIKDIKRKLREKRAKTEGISNGKPFETIQMKDLNWLKMVTKELDKSPWYNKKCAHCEYPLSTEHLKTCTDTEQDRNTIENETGLEAKSVIEDPSLLNQLPIHRRKKLKSFVAEKNQ